jgi:hypothetical protein
LLLGKSGRKKYMENLGAGIILRRILMRKLAKTGLSWLRIGASSGILDTVMNLGVL